MTPDKIDNFLRDYLALPIGSNSHTNAKKELLTLIKAEVDSRITVDISGKDTDDYGEERHRI